MKRLQDRIALVTGSSSGVGADIARELASQGASIIINGRYRRKVSDMQYELEKTYKVTTYSCVADATDDKSVCSALSEIFPNKSDHLDILINNVGGVEKFGSFFDLTDADWIRSYELNCMSAVRFSRHTFPWLCKSKSPKIVNISSVSARQLGNFNPHYGCAKMALNYLTKYLALQLASSQILVNAICPSTLDGGEWEDNIQDRARRLGVSFEESAVAMRKNEEAKSPLKRMGSPKHIAKLAAFLASDENQFISGAIIPHDGATTRTIL
ncbi:MAG: SDR family oxidoreductase [bacterium]|nr:SDR family oxidoreductase [bacterium]